MLNVKYKTIGFGDVCDRVMNITRTGKTELVNVENSNQFCDISKYSEYGLATLGKTVGFPAQFVRDIYDTTYPSLANEIVADRMKYYFENSRPEFYARNFNEKICGVVSNKYNTFDDNQVIEIIEGSTLSKMAFQNAIITPERLHLRAIDTDNPFHIGGDDSELYFAYFIDNSMVGQSSFKVQLGVYRLACTNGMIVPVRDFVICRAIHRGTKDIAAEFNESVAFLAEKQDRIKELITGMSNEDATISTLKEEFRKDYLQKKLNINSKEYDKVINLYEFTYDGKTKWGMLNAITEFARDLKDINRREYLERAAFNAA